MDYIKEITKEPSNKGILLVVNSPGGSVYTSDELYYALMDYKQATNRPIYCYFESYACSGGYYISMAANEIYSNRNTWTGSIGVISQMYDLTGLYEKLGIKEVDITSGRNKAMGSSGQTLTEEQHAIMQSLVDEAYEQFVGIVAQGRGMSVEKVKEIADGRVLSASQALNWKLIDGISRYDEYQKHISDQLGNDITFYEPPERESNIFTSLFSKAQDMLPKSDTEVMTDFANTLKRGLWYYAE
jgi:protease-4